MRKFRQNVSCAKSQAKLKNGIYCDRYVCPANQINIFVLTETKIYLNITDIEQTYGILQANIFILLCGRNFRFPFHGIANKKKTFENS